MNDTARHDHARQGAARKGWVGRHERQRRNRQQAPTNPHLIPHGRGARRFGTFPVPIQEHPGAPVEIVRVDMPMWLSRTEADRICRVVQAIANDDEDVASLWAAPAPFRTDEDDDPGRYGGWA